jgi:predicted glycosyltransferase
MKAGIIINHPSQFYFFKNIITELEGMGWEITIFIKDKDRLEEIIENSDFTYVKIISRHKRNKNKLTIYFFSIFELLAAEFILLQYNLKNRLDVLLGTDAAITHIGKLFSIPSFVFNEDDFIVNKSFCRMAYPLATNIIAPNTCNVGKYEDKKIGYDGYQKLSYLHPNHFTPNIDIVHLYKLVPYHYFIIRVVSLDAVHDMEHINTGLSTGLLKQLIENLTLYGRVVISTENKIDDYFDKYILQLNPAHMHHLLAFARFFIGDSQSMAVECAMLGTPFIRYSDFVGKINVLDELENKYLLGYGIRTHETGKLLTCMDNLQSNVNLHEEWQQKRKTMLADKVDVVEFVTGFLRNYFSDITVE